MAQQSFFKKKSSKVFDDFPLFIFSEHKQYNQILHQRTIFPYINIQNVGKLERMITYFSFRSIQFNKKRALPFFLAIELLTNQKSVASLSNRNIQAWKIRKGSLAGCKGTLRRNSLRGFIDTLSLAITRREKFQPTRNYLVKTTKKAQSISYKLEPVYVLNLKELVLFYPIELGLGQHPDVRHVGLHFGFSFLCVEEQFFLLRYFKIPIF